MMLMKVEKNTRLVTLMGDFETSWVNGQACLNNYRKLSNINKKTETVQSSIWKGSTPRNCSKL